MTSIYYQAKRNRPLTEAEQEKLTKILEESAAKYPFSDQGETLCRYAADLMEPDCIFSGSVKMPYGDELESEDLLAMQSEALFYFIEWLTKLRRVIPDGDWEVSLEEFPLIWEEETGWRLMTDAEYQAVF